MSNYFGCYLVLEEYNKYMLIPIHAIYVAVYQFIRIYCNILLMYTLQCTIVYKILVINFKYNDSI